ncbi:MAG TPA: hypothetical protein DEP84_28590 [Chloroflexi bacterium]|nr:hypothetical protein [Chloroflexota bacterium]
MLSLLVGLLLSLVTWGALRARKPAPGDPPTETPSVMILGFLVFAAFALGVFISYVLLRPPF